LPASTTKVIAALTAFDHYGLDDVLEVKRVVEEGQSMELVKGEKMTFENLLYGMLVHSGNDAAYVVADNYPGGYRAFVDAMNVKAQQLGMMDSHFRNPAGLDSALQRSSAYDLALAGRELLRNKSLSKIVSTKSITVSDIDYVHFHPLYNVNRLLGEIPGVAGLKTGKTDLAGENLITLYKRKDKEYLIVLLRSEDRFTDTQTLVDWIQQQVDYQKYENY
jgi:D-alanyl-D-alanine carboxypeptidase